MIIKDVFDKVAKSGDQAIREYSKTFDNYDGPLKCNEVELKMAYQGLASELRNALEISIENVSTYHEAIRPVDKVFRPFDGLTIQRRFVAFDPVGIYVPAGRYPLFSSLLMSAVPAQIAGCQDIIVCTPPRSSELILAVAYRLGLKKVFRIGGAQAIAGMAKGTETLPKCQVICGPGNSYVTMAKEYIRQTMLDVQIDMPAGPSEIAVAIDTTTNPEFAAADLLSQAEHDPSSRCFLISMDKSLTSQVEAKFFKMGQSLDISMAQLKSQLEIFQVDDSDDLVRTVDQLAPEHLSLQTIDARELAQRVRCAGSIFVGPWTPETLGDYVNGPSHVLPTNSSAKIFSGLSVESFGKFMSIQSVESPRGFARLAPAARTMAMAEGLRAHALAVEVRQRHEDLQS